MAAQNEGGGPTGLLDSLPPEMAARLRTDLERDRAALEADAVLKAKRTEEANRFLDRMPRKVRQAFLLRFVEGRLHAEIIAMLRISRKELERRLVRACEFCAVYDRMLEGD